ncbi:MAG: alanine--tRNA ligase [Elusimicrobia bacterium]|nr:alanine--tRNA ligase [Elusimicrobiota bacterium]
MQAQEIRKKFLDYFEQRQHRVYPSASLIPADPTLLFNSAGMVPFKNRFLGVEKGPPRATSVQLCMRTTDIDRVGFTKRHLTFFEMLGNFSFGDYFKTEAIGFAWEFLTKELGLPKDKLWTTVYKEDDQAENLWKKHGPVKIIPLGEDSNFWSMGPTGPCGPCSEIYWDFGADKGCGPDCNPGHDNCERFLEIWNLVFMQFDRQTDGRLVSLAKPCIDTGMGLERITAVVQGKESIFDVGDLFLSHATLASLGCLVMFDIAKNKPAADDPHVKELRIIQDHVRSASFLVSQGVLPSNEGKGYILRRLIRRALSHGMKLRIDKEPFLWNLAKTFMTLPAFKNHVDLQERYDMVQEVIKTEEKKFLETLERGKKFMDELIKEVVEDQIKKTSGRKFELPGDKLFYLYETYGYPLELAREIAKEQGLDINEADFQAAEEKAKDIARKGWKGSGAESEAKYIELREKLKLDKVAFTGYEALSAKTQITAVLDLSLNPLREAVENQEVYIALSQTPFYPEGGGQIGDRGSINGTNATAEVTDTQTPIAGLILHKAKVSKGKLAPNEPVEARVEQSWRMPTSRHHSATHLLHWALRKLVGHHVTQAGSNVGPDKFRLDFTHGNSLKGAALQEIEALVNETIKADLKRERKELTLEEARQSGAMTLFNEKYGEKVFVVRFGESFEACGGTHVLSTGQIGPLKILKESSVAAGVRRIEAASGDALKMWEDKQKIQQPAAPKKEKEAATVALGEAKTLEGKTPQGIAYKIQVFSQGDSQQLRNLNDQERKSFEGVILQSAAINGKTGFVIGVHENLIRKGLAAGNLAKQLAQKLGGSAGGRPDFAQGGFASNPAPKDIETALLAILQ